MNMDTFKKLLIAAGLGLGGKALVSQRRWLDLPPALPAKQFREMQNDALKINWGRPGFCTEFATDYNAGTGRCASGAVPYQRTFISK